MRTITPDDIYRYYLGEIIVGDMYNSPIPTRKDDTPSFQLYDDEGVIKWKDYGLPDQFGNKPENLVQYLKGLPLTVGGWHQAIRIIKQEVQIGIIGKPLTQLGRRPKSDIAPYAKTDRGWKDFELAYWERFNIDKHTLEYEDIKPLESMSWAGEGGRTHVQSSESDPAFIYWWNRNPASWKMYRPLGLRRDKFRQNNIKGVIEGWNSMIRAHQLSSKGKFDILFITSSTKDRLVIKHCYDSPIYYNAINPKGESDYTDITAKRHDICNLADRVVVLYDCDKAGFKGSMKLASMTGFESFDMRGVLGTWVDPEEGVVPTKDISDFVDTKRGKHSYDELRTIIDNIIKI